MEIYPSYGVRTGTRQPVRVKQVVIPKNNKKHKARKDHMPRHISGEEKIRKARIAYVSTIPVGAAGTTPVTLYINSTFVTSAANWTYWKNLYQQFRVKQIRLQGTPNQTSASPVATYQGMFAIARFWGGSTSLATTFNTLINEPGVQISSTLEQFSYETNVKGFADGLLWNSTNVVIPTGNQFGLAYQINPSIAMVASSQVYDILLDFEVEFMNPW